MVTGAGSGIGRAIALALAGSATELILVGRRPGSLAATAAEVSAAGGQGQVKVADLEDDDAVEQLATSLGDGALDVLVHAAGIHLLAPVETTTMAEFDHVYRTNIRGPFMLTRLTLPLLEKAHGEVVFVNSSITFHPRAGVSAYAASKHGLRGFADALRAEINPRGVRVLTVYPGRTATQTQAEIHVAENRPYRPEQLLQPADVAAVVLAALGLPRTAEVTEIAIRPFRR